MRMRGHQRPAQPGQIVPGQRRTHLPRQRPQDRPVLARLAGREARAQRQLRAPFGVDEQARLLDPGRRRQDDVGAMRAAVAMAALIDHLGAGGDVDLVDPERKDGRRPRQARRQARLHG
jgi:hypothetical protein